MAKDPAFLFYPGDWQGGTMYMDHQTKGAYMDLIILQFNVGKFTIAQAKQVLSICFDLAWANLEQKFSTDGNFYWNERLKKEIDKRQKFTKSRRDNALSKKNKEAYAVASAEHMLQHMENENTTTTIKDNKGVKGEKKENEIPVIHLNETLKSIDVLATDALSDKLNFVEHVMRQSKMTELQVSAALYSFVSFLKSGGETVKTSKDFRFHFQNWLKKQDKTLFRINNPVNGKPLTNIPNAKDVVEKYK